MYYPNLIPLLLTLLLFPQVFVEGGLWRELRRKFSEIFKFSKPQRSGPFYNKCDLCSFGPCTPVIWPSKDENFDATADAKKIMNILITTDNTKPLTEEEKATVAHILIERSAPQRTAIAEAFQKECGKRIIDKLADRMDSTYRYYKLIKALSLPLPQLYQYQFEVVLEFFGKSEYYHFLARTMIAEMFFTLPRCLLEQAIESYNSIPGRDLVSDIGKALKASGSKPLEYQEVFMKMVELKRDKNKRASWIKALIFARKLRSAVISRQEKEMKERFIELFMKFSIPQIFETMVVYENLRHDDKEFKSLYDDIDVYSGEEKYLYRYILKLLKKDLYFVEHLEYMLKSEFKEHVFEDRIIFIFVGRYDIDLLDLVTLYEQKYETGLLADFEGWDVSKLAVGFHPAMVELIIKALRMREHKA